MDVGRPPKPLWLSELVAVWGYVQRNYFLTKRYLMWEIVWLVYVTINAKSGNNALVPGGPA